MASLEALPVELQLTILKKLLTPDNGMIWALLALTQASPSCRRVALAYNLVTSWSFKLLREQKINILPKE